MTHLTLAAGGGFGHSYPLPRVKHLRQLPPHTSRSSLVEKINRTRNEAPSWWLRGGGQLCLFAASGGLSHCLCSHLGGGEGGVSCHSHSWHTEALRPVGWGAGSGAGHLEGDKATRVHVTGEDEMPCRTSQAMSPLATSALLLPTKLGPHGQVEWGTCHPPRKQRHDLPQHNFLWLPWSRRAAESPQMVVGLQRGPWKKFFFFKIRK